MKIYLSKILTTFFLLHLSIQVLAESLNLPLQTGLGKKCSDPSWRHVILRETDNYSEKGADRILEKWNKNRESALPQWNEAKYQEYWTEKNRDNGENMMREFLYLDKLVFAECKSNNGKYLPIIEAWIEKMCHITWSPAAQDDFDKKSNKKKQSYYNGEEYYVDLMSAEFAGILGQTYYMLNDSLSTKIKNLIETTIDKRIFKPMRKTFDELDKNQKILSLPYHDWFVRRASNWNIVCWTGVTMAALTINKDQAERSKFLKYAWEHTKIYLDSFTEEGICTEGTSYYNYGVGNYIVLRQLILEATGKEMDLFDAKNISKVLSIAKNPIEYQMTPTSGAHFGDDKVQLNFNPGIVNYMKSAFLKKQPNNFFTESWSWSRFNGDVLYYDLRMNPENRKTASKREDYTNLDFYQYYPDSGILVSRPDDTFKVNGLAATIKYFGGSEEEGGGHNHDEVGAYVISVNGLIVAGDVGCQSYDGDSFDKEKRFLNGRANSYGHPVPFINGKVQKRSWLVEKNKPFIFKEHSKFNEKGIDRIVYDMKQAYDDPSIISLNRTYEYTRINDTKQTVKITDRVTFNKESAFEVAMTSLGDWIENSNHKSGKFTYKPKYNEEVKIHGPQSVNAEIQSDQDFYLNETSLSNTNTLIYTRVGITLKNKVRSAWISVTFSN